MSTVSAIIPTWNRADLLASILANLGQLTRPPEQVIVVDNGSSDGSCSVAREAGAELLGFTENRGFAVAVNEGIRRATSDWVLIVNNDVVLAPDWLERILGALNATGASFGVGKLLRQEDRTHLDGSWDLLSRGAYAWRCGYEKLDGGVWSQRRTVAFAPMTAAMFHRSVFERVGLIDERFESYYEDVDFGLRCARAGISGIYEPAAVASHSSKTTFGRKGSRVYFLSSRNQVFLLAKHYSPALLRRLLWPVLVGQTLAVLAAAKQGHLFAAIRGKWAALWMWSSLRPRDTESEERSGASVGSVQQIVTESESQIRSLQEKVGFDPYWRLYFSLVRPG
jgi:GT2 family glycosyltransferase